MSYPVITDFIEQKHKNTLYRKGETYPKKGFKANAERVKELQSKKNAYNTPFLGKENGNNEDPSQEETGQSNDENQSPTK